MFNSISGIRDSKYKMNNNIERTDEFNLNYKNDKEIEKIQIEKESINEIDKQLDNLADFGEGSYLCYFDNAGHKDLKLIYKNRIVKIFLTETDQISPETESCLISEARDIINKLEHCLKVAKK